MPRWRKNSEFGPGPRVPLDREQRAQWLAKLLLNRRPGRLTLGTAAVGRVLVGMLGQDGRLDPAIDRLAELARVSRSTVSRALVQLQERGFLAWTRRLVRDAATGWRCEQATNAYRLTVPACGAHVEPAVCHKEFKKEASGSAGWVAQCESAARQLLALGLKPPREWFAP